MWPISNISVYTFFYIYIPIRKSALQIEFWKINLTLLFFKKTYRQICSKILSSLTLYSAGVYVSMLESVKNLFHIQLDLKQCKHWKLNFFFIYTSFHIHFNKQLLLISLSLRFLQSKYKNFPEKNKDRCGINGDHNLLITFMYTSSFLDY